MTEPVYSRAPDVVWRLGPDRVLVRRIGGGEEAALDLMGEAALVWVALDEPIGVSGLIERISEIRVRPSVVTDEHHSAHVRLAVGDLLEHRLICVSPS